MGANEWKMSKKHSKIYMICISIKILSDNTENDNTRLQECDYKTFCCIGYAAQKESGRRKSLLPCSHTHTHVSCTLFVAGVAGCFTVVFSDSWCWVLPVVITQSEPADNCPQLYGTDSGIADEQFWTQSTATLNCLFPCSSFPFQYCLVI